METGQQVEVQKGKHQGKVGVIVTVHKVYIITIRFTNGKEGRTLPSSVRVISNSTRTPIVEDEETIPIVIESPARDTEEYRVMTVAMLTELLAQGLALSKHSDEQLEQELKSMQVRIRELRRNHDG